MLNIIEEYQAGNRYFGAADLSDADLSAANLSGATGLFDAIAWLEEHCEHDEQGIIVYKVFGLNYSAPASWSLSPGSIITEIINPCPTTDCACGINVALLDWIKRNADSLSKVWKCRIRWTWLIGAVVPYDTDGKFRTARLELLQEVNKKEDGK